MITLEQYLTQHCAPDEVPADVATNAAILLPMVEALHNEPGCPVSWAESDLRSGYRPAAFNASTPGAAKNSKHMRGEAVDESDPGQKMNNWLTDEILAKYNLYREHPSATRGENPWLHLQNQPPPSGHRTFFP